MFNTLSRASRWAAVALAAVLLASCHPGPAPATPGSALAAEGVAQGASCSGGERCAAGLQCMTYYGGAGAGGPKLATCEIPCASRDGKCPDGQTCTEISDGPGRVCRPRS